MIFKKFRFCIEHKIIKTSILAKNVRLDLKCVSPKIWRKNQGIGFQKGQEFMDFENLTILEKLDFQWVPAGVAKNSAFFRT